VAIKRDRPLGHPEPDTQEEKEWNKRIVNMKRFHLPNSIDYYLTFSQIPTFYLISCDKKRFQGYAISIFNIPHFESVPVSRQLHQI
jgi:hypothetical protein